MNINFPKSHSILKQFWLKPIPVLINYPRPEGRGNLFNIYSLF